MMQVYMNSILSPMSSTTPMSPISPSRTSADRHAQLLTPISHFPSRMLPPPGTTPRVLPSNASRILAPGTAVEVRRFNIRTCQWMPWVSGIVLARRCERFHAGLEVEMYDVRASCPQIGTWVETYIPYVGELRDGNVYFPSDDAKDMYSRIADMKKVFACVGEPNSQGSVTQTWVPALVTSRRSDPHLHVLILAGPLKGQTRTGAPSILPYTPETAAAIRKTGQAICLEIGSD